MKLDSTSSGRPDMVRVAHNILLGLLERFQEGPVKTRDEAPTEVSN